jgi:rfaE bifunctional protein nucleotidyltransferase chain/domain
MLVPTLWGFEESSVLPTGCCAKRILVKEQHKTHLCRHSAKDRVLIVSSEGLVWFESGINKETMTGFWLESNSSIQVPKGWWYRITAIRDTILYETESELDGHGQEKAEEGCRLAPDDFRELLAAYVKDNCKTRILEVDEAASVALGVRASKRKIGFCNGCFDLIHIGHLELFLQAKLRCDVLFVAVNSDTSIKQLKGALRPFVDEVARTNMVASIRYVDYVVRNPDTTCVAAVKAVSPDVYVKTREHGDSGPEAQAVKAMGGVIEVIDMIQGYSTSIVANQVAKSLVKG